MNMKVIVSGVGMIPFAKPGNHEPYFRMAAKATAAALTDAGIGYDKVEQAYVGDVYRDSTAGQRAGPGRPSCAASTCGSRVSRTWAMRSAAAAAWSTSCRSATSAVCASKC